MWRSWDQISRTRKALEFRGLNPDKLTLDGLVGVLIKRGMSDTKLCAFLNVITNNLEPPGCQMCHCDAHRVAGFCNCCDNLVPSKCKKHRDFLKRCKVRAVTATEKLFAELGDDKNRINRNLPAFDLFFLLEKLKGFEFVGKWSSRLKRDVWEEMQEKDEKERR